MAFYLHFFSFFFRLPHFVVGSISLTTDSFILPPLNWSVCWDLPTKLGRVKTNESSYTAQSPLKHSCNWLACAIATAPSFNQFLFSFLSFFFLSFLIINEPINAIAAKDLFFFFTAGLSLVLPFCFSPAGLADYCIYTTVLFSFHLIWFDCAVMQFPWRLIQLHSPLAAACYKSACHQRWFLVVSLVFWLPDCICFADRCNRARQLDCFDIDRYFDSSTTTSF